jgi:thiol-disulfide isomerase/thioredoxin
MFSIVLLDKNGNGLHDDFGIDLIALAPNNWLELNGERFNHLNFVPIKENQAIYIYDHFEAIRDINERMAKTSLSKRADDYITFPYTIPQLVKNTIDDEAIDFRELTEKKKFVYFEFWGTWCKPCVAQIPDLKRLEKEYGDQVMIVGISSNDKKEKLIEVVSKLNMAWPQIQMDEEISEAFGNVYSFPLGVLYDQHGKLISFGIKPKDITRVLSRNE